MVLIVVKFCGQKTQNPNEKCNEWCQPSLICLLVTTSTLMGFIFPPGVMDFVLVLALVTAGDALPISHWAELRVQGYPWIYQTISM